jgi:hypothetical protein
VQRGERSGGEAGNGGEGLGFVIKREAAVQGGGVDAVHGEGGDVHGQLLVRRGGAAARLRVLGRGMRPRVRGIREPARGHFCLRAVRENDVMGA